MALTKFRFVVSEKMKEELENFSKIHLCKNHKTIKDEWSDWVDENTDFIIEEKSDLQEKGYEGTLEEFIDKLFFSVKYYYMKLYKKGVDGVKKTAPKVAAKAAQKIKISKNMIKTIDKHIHSILQLQSIDCPSNCYLDFITRNKEYIYNEILSSNTPRVREYFEKIKKCYKNRYYNSRNDDA